MTKTVWVLGLKTDSWGSENEPEGIFASRKAAINYLESEGVDIELFNVLSKGYDNLTKVEKKKHGEFFAHDLGYWPEDYDEAERYVSAGKYYLVEMEVKE